MQWWCFFDNNLLQVLSYTSSNAARAHTFLSIVPDALLHRHPHLYDKTEQGYVYTLFSMACRKCWGCCNAQRCIFHPWDATSLGYRRSSRWNQCSSSPPSHQAEALCAQLQQTNKTACSEHWAQTITVKLYGWIEPNIVVVYTTNTTDQFKFI